MNAQETSIRHSALGWVKKSIDDNLSEIESSLKRYIEENETELLAEVKQRLCVIQGALVMVEQYGAALLTEEMVALVDFIVAEKGSRDDPALEVLLRAVMQLPDYLEHIQSGHRDIPIAILPLLNDVRAVRNQDLFSEKLLFLPDLSMHEGEAEMESIDDDSNQASRLLAKKLRPVYQLALVNIIRDRSVEESLKRLEKICERLEERSVSEQIARIWWIVGALIESVSRQQLELGASIKSLLGKVDALFRVILIIGERGLLKRQPVELIKNFLYYIAQPECDGPKAKAIKTAYRLEQFLPSESQRSEVLDNIAGPNQALLKTVAEAMKAEIETIKSTLEVYVNGDLSKVEALKDLPQEMHVISDTLAMIGLGPQRQLIESQIGTVKRILKNGGAVDEEQLLSMAAELLQVEQALEQMPRRQASANEEPRSESDVSRDYELDSVLSAIVTAALDDIQKTKSAILEFIKDPERRDNIELCITLMLELRGALLLLEEQRAVSVVDGLLTYLRGYELSEFMESTRLDALSQVVVSLECYLEALGERRSDANSLLDLADSQLKKLLASLPAAGSSQAAAKPVSAVQEPPAAKIESVQQAPIAEVIESDQVEQTQVLQPPVAVVIDNEPVEQTQVLQAPGSAAAEPEAGKLDSTQVMDLRETGVNKIEELSLKPATDRSGDQPSANVSADATSNEPVEQTQVLQAAGSAAEEPEAGRLDSTQVMDLREIDVNKIEELSLKPATDRSGDQPSANVNADATGNEPVEQTQVLQAAGSAAAEPEAGKLDSTQVMDLRETDVNKIEELSLKPATDRSGDQPSANVNADATGNEPVEQTQVLQAAGSAAEEPEAGKLDSTQVMDLRETDVNKIEELSLKPATDQSGDQPSANVNADATSNEPVEQTQVLQAAGSAAAEPEAGKLDSTQVMDLRETDVNKIEELLLKPATDRFADQPSANVSADAISNAPDLDATVVMQGRQPGVEQVEPTELISALHGAVGRKSVVSENRDQRPDGPDASASQSIEIVPVEDNPEVLKSGSDAEILEIYLEEAEEESLNIERLQQDWLLHPEDQNALRNIRRAFHTIKGSGRLVGAIKIGEFAWDYEQLLNRVIDKTVLPEKQVIIAVGKAGKALKQLVHELKTFEEPSADIGYLRGLARALAKFKTEELLINHTQTMEIIESPYDHITDDDEEKPASTDYSFGATTQMIESDPTSVEADEWIGAQAAAMESGSVEAAADNVQPAADETQVVDNVRPAADETQVVEEASVVPDTSKYDDTVLTSSPPVTSMDDRRQVEAEVRAKIAAVARARAEARYQRAPDYSRAAPVAEDVESDASVQEAPDFTPDVAPDTLNMPDAESSQPIEIESMGDDFVGEGVDIQDNEIDAMMFSSTPVAANSSTDLPPLEFEEVAIGTDDQQDAGSAQTQEPESEEIVMEMSDELEEFETEEIVMEMPGETDDFEAEEIVMEMPGEPDDFEAEEIMMEMPGEPEESVSEENAIEMSGGLEEFTAEEIMMEMLGELEEPGTQQIVMGMPEELVQPEAEEIVLEMLEELEESEAEEIVMEMPAEPEQYQTEEIVMVTDEESELPEAAPEIIELSPLQEVELQAIADSSVDEAIPAVDEVASSARTEIHAQPNREEPPDPFDVTTMSPMPGVEAGGSVSRAPGQLEPTGLSFDPELLTIYQQEVEQHLSTVSFALDHAEEIGELVPSEEMYRALHTIHGASRTADIGSIGELASLLEKPLKTAIAQKMGLDHEIVALYRQGQYALQAMTAELVDTRQMPDIPSDLQISLKALAQDFEEHTVDLSDQEIGQSGDFIDTLTMMNDSVDHDQDMELLSIFVEEANELLEMSDNTLHQWSQQDPDDPTAQDYGAVMELQRYLHTLKGGARMAEIKQISDLSHEMESLFIAVIDGRVEKSENLIESLKDAFDLLHQQVNEAEQGGQESGSSEMVDALKKLRFGEDDQARSESADESLEFDGDSEDIDIVSENLPGEPLSNADRSAQEVIKVRADLLDNLVSSAGEVSIYRARMEQQVAGLGSHLGELGQTIARLKTQLRSLEAETDAQIHFSHRAESTRAGEFDPLEMDRYTLIQELSRSLGESVNDLSSLQHMLGDQVKDSETLLLQQSRVNTDLQDGLIKSRMVKFSGLLSRLRRLVRQSSQELGKKAELMVTGEENEVDNKVLDRMVAPLEHIIRNALSHGVETPVERVKKGKPEEGKITIEITRDGSDVVIKVSDDGAGVDIEKVRSRAIQLGLLERGQVASDTDLVQFILEPGFSTAEQVTQLSGRGVGMDVVGIEVKQLGGTLQIETTPKGTTFVARLPFTLSINQAILVRCDDETYAIPLLNIEGITRIDAKQMHDYYRQDAPEIEYAGQNFALHNLARLVGAESLFRAGSDDQKQAVILSRSGDLRVALHVDEIIGNREIVVKTLGKQLSQVKSLAGASILADGSVVLILDVGGLIRQNVGSTVKVVYSTPPDAPTKLRDTVMVVDDSITMRRVATKLLERHNYEVITAKDGVDALAQLQDVLPDVVLLDVEMPRMDGFELATHMQNESSFSNIPIIMITSRTGEKHRDRAFEIGVTNYMGKPYQEDELIENIQSALRGA